MRVTDEVSEARVEIERAERRGFLDAANLLTLLRLPLGGVVWVDADRPWFVLAVMAAAGMTDVLDGRLARRAPSGPLHVGAWLDPLCDKFFMLSVLLAVGSARDAPPAILLLIAARELVQIPLAALYAILRRLGRQLQYDFRAAVVGKVATVSQFLAVSALLLDHPFTRPLAVVAGVIGVAAALYYFARGA
ncbi:MAG: CDP-alcohol phosphatidyltransferase family protein [Planctomycetes bacterium]|nr:CDP-alcohol phosphatidyltransferase family protein [Planctomycetota bacterium]